MRRLVRSQRRALARATERRFLEEIAGWILTSGYPTRPTSKTVAKLIFKSQRFSLRIYTKLAEPDITASLIAGRPLTVLTDEDAVPPSPRCSELPPPKPRLQ